MVIVRLSWEVLAHLTGGDKQGNDTHQTAVPDTRAQGSFILCVCPNIGGAQQQEHGGQDIDGTLRGFACSVGNDDGGGIKRQHFVAVLFCGKKPCRFAECLRAVAAGFAVGFGIKQAGGLFSQEGAQAVKQGEDKYAEIGEGHRGFLIVGLLGRDGFQAA